MKKIYISLIVMFLFAALQAQNGQVKGKIIDASTNEPIPFANVILDGTQIYSTSDLDGNFIFTGLEPGYVKFRVVYIGYTTTLSQDILVSNNKIPYVEIKMQPTDFQVDQVVITTDPFQKDEESPISMQRIGIKEIESNPGSNRDISRVIQSFPGVGSTPAFRNDVIVRGGGPSESRFFLDGIEIPVLNHFATQGASGGPVGIINADFIESVNYYSGSFPADRGNALSGIFDFKQKEGNMDKLSLQATLGASETALTLDGPLGEKTSYIFSVRRSYLQFLFSAIGLPFLPTFNDYQFKVKTSFNTRNTLTIISLGALDNLVLNTGIDDPDPSQEYILTQIPINNQWSYVVGAIYKNFFGSGSQSFVLSRNMLDNSFFKYPDNNESLTKIFDYNSQEVENKFRYELNLRKAGFKINFGVNTEFVKYNNSTFQQVYINNQQLDIDYNSKIDFFKYGTFGQISRNIFNQKLLVSVGLRTDANNFSDNMSNLAKQLSPRVALSYSVNDKISINAGSGRYFQLPAYTTLGYRNVDGELLNKNISYIGNNQVNLGVETKINQTILLSVEGFYKDYFNYPIDTLTGSSIANSGAGYSSISGAVPVISTGTGRAVGFEVLNRVKLQKFNLIASYTFVRSEFTDINGTLIPSSWDSKHLLTITGSKDFKNNWRAGFKWRFVGGLPYTPYDLDYSAIIPAWNANGQPYLDYTKLNGERFKPFHQLDIRVDKNFFFDKWTLMIYVDIQNAYNFKSDSQPYVIRQKNPDGSFATTADGTRYILEEIPSISGTVLPTLGLMIKL
ncbi:MAG: carboxypeptidase-like regulatory domain-containing protein [Bacteroidales bacterium]|nr:carboxypeptidase-like regulatory domain-containing protein [Bacteroidales bacterium]